ncbi:MAG: hypothetical protein JWM42_297 [Burkholderia sp.]|jgi:hypothetical protein|nr:hypothetical protein [Burkholderia sp.]
MKPFFYMSVLMCLHKAAERRLLKGSRPAIKLCHQRRAFSPGGDAATTAKMNNLLMRGPLLVRFLNFELRLCAFDDRRSRRRHHVGPDVVLFDQAIERHAGYAEQRSRA